MSVKGTATLVLSILNKSLDKFPDFTQSEKKKFGKWDRMYHREKAKKRGYSKKYPNKYRNNQKMNNAKQQRDKILSMWNQRIG